jgi:aminomethyltransferase
LFDLAIDQKARMTAFSGWEMPLQFSGITQEHQAIRTAAGMFDISHMGKFAIAGKGLTAQLQHLVPSDLSRLQAGQAQYTVLLNSEAGILDDVIFYCQGEVDGQEHWLAIVNAATRLKDKTWLLEHLESVAFHDHTTKILLAVQGSESAKHLAALVDADLATVKPFGHLEAPILGKIGFLARTGYTGEDGFEIMVDAAIGLELWRSLLASGVIPCGLGARDTLRLEAGMALYGQDIDATTTPLEAGLGWLVHWDKGDFIGRSALAQQRQTGVPRKLVGLQMQGRNIARHNYPVVHAGETVGIITSGTLSITLGRAIALAYVPTALSQAGQLLDVEIRGKLHPATVVKKPFYRRAVAKP